MNDQNKEHIEQNKSWILPEKMLSNHKFVAGIEKAEEGPFHSIQKSIENFDIWLTSKENK